MKCFCWKKVMSLEKLTSFLQCTRENFVGRDGNKYDLLIHPEVMEGGILEGE